jgi:hypothetical protein
MRPSSATMSSRRRLASVLISSPASVGRHETACARTSTRKPLFDLPQPPRQRGVYSQNCCCAEMVPFSATAIRRADHPSSE